MNRRDFLQTIGAASAFPTAGLSAAKQPNIVLMMADDMGFSGLGCHGSEIATPHLDRLAAAGVRFAHFYNTAKCCPTRASLLTGLFPHQAGIGDMENDDGSPHWPLHALPEDIAKYKGRYDCGWDVIREERHRRMLEAGIVEKRWPLSPRDKQIPAWKDAPGKAWEARRMEVYAAQIGRMDRAIGRILQKIDDMGAAENTLVLFLADNGGCHVGMTAGRKGDYVPKATRDGRPVQIGNDPNI